MFHARSAQGGLLDRQADLGQWHPGHECRGRYRTFGRVLLRENKMKSHKAFLVLHTFRHRSTKNRPSGLFQDLEERRVMLRWVVLLRQRHRGSRREELYTNDALLHGVLLRERQQEGEGEAGKKERGTSVGHPLLSTIPADPSSGIEEAAVSVQRRHQSRRWTRASRSGAQTEAVQSSVATAGWP